VVHLGVRQLLPEPLEAVDLVTTYAFPTDRPWVRANMVATVDGGAAVNGATRGLSGPADKHAFEVIRQLADVVLVGAGTVRAEKYAAEPVKPEHAERRQLAGQTPAPPIAVVSRSLDLDPTSGLFVGAPSRTIVITCEAAPASRRRELAGVADLIDAGSDQVDIGAAVDALHTRGLRKVSCEGGPLLLGTLVAADRLDELCFTLSPLLLGGTAPRLLAGHLLPRLVSVQLTHLLEAEGFLFVRYLVDRPPRTV
jgi:riboflavin biosynthesis pyrimidine reductase